MIANELTTKTEFLTLTFGLTEGWWMYDDQQWRMPGEQHRHRLAGRLRVFRRHQSGPLLLLCAACAFRRN